MSRSDHRQAVIFVRVNNLTTYAIERQRTFTINVSAEDPDEAIQLALRDAMLVAEGSLDGEVSDA